MKIFFFKKIPFMQYIKESSLIYIILFVFGIVIFAQGSILLNIGGTKDVSVIPEVSTSPMFLKIENGSFEGVKLFLNGEEEVEFKSVSLSVYPPENAVVEIYNPANAPITIVLDNPYIIKECQKGLNYIAQLK